MIFTITFKIEERKPTLLTRTLERVGLGGRPNQQVIVEKKGPLLLDRAAHESGHAHNHRRLAQQVPIALKQHCVHRRLVAALAGHANRGGAARLVGEALGLVHLGRDRLDLGQRRRQLRVIGAVGVRVSNHLAQQQGVAARREKDRTIKVGVNIQ